MHLDDLLDALVLVIERRAKLPPEVPILLGESEPLTYDELQGLTYLQVKGTGIANTCPVVEQGSSNVKVRLHTLGSAYRWIAAPMANGSSVSVVQLWRLGQ
jgi:hypothetical protein